MVIYKTLHRKLKIEQHEQLKYGGEGWLKSDVPEG
jgi:hypothetical protein